MGTSEIFPQSCLGLQMGGS